MRLECPIHGIVPREETVKGYEIAKDEYVRFEPDELTALEQASSSALVIDSFVPEGALDPVYFENTYYLGAGKNGERGYRVLAQALQRTLLGCQPLGIVPSAESTELHSRLVCYPRISRWRVEAGLVRTARRGRLFHCVVDVEY
jgi:Ku70/Ku80 beta-barrel domain